MRKAKQDTENQAASQAAPEPSPAVDAYLNLTLAADALIGSVQRLLRPHNLTPSQLAILELLVRRGPMHHRQIGQWVSRSSGNVTTVVDNLERRNLVRRERSRKDRRCVTVHLTSEGRSTAEKILPAYVEEVSKAMAPLSAAELASLTKLTGALRVKDEADAGE